MGLLIALAIGIAVGGVVGLFIMENPDTLLFNILMGIVGSLFGLGFYYLVLTDGSALTEGLFSLPASLCSIIAALLFVMGFNAIHKAVHKIPLNQDKDT